MGDLGPELLIESRQRNLVALRTKKQSTRGGYCKQGEVLTCRSYLKCWTLMVVVPELWRIPYFDFPNTLTDTQRQHRHATYQSAENN